MGVRAAAWRLACIARVEMFRPESAEGPRPRTEARLAYDANRLYGQFRVEDPFVRVRHTRFQDPVYEDSCVEFFLEPPGGRGYLNFEFNAGGAFRVYHITDPARVPGGFRAFRPLTPEEGAQVKVKASLPAVVEPERAGPVIWTLTYAIPWSLVTACTGAPAPRPGEGGWRGNFYKCGDRTSHPHWAAWAPVDELNFHRPACFGNLVFEEAGS